MSKEKKFECPKCGKKLSSKSGFKAHLRMSHKQDRSEEKDKAEEKTEEGEKKQKKQGKKQGSEKSQESSDSFFKLFGSWKVIGGLIIGAILIYLIRKKGSDQDLSAETDQGSENVEVEETVEDQGFSLRG